MGRIVCDSEGHLNASSVLLEGTLQHSKGHSVKLDLSQLPSYRLFPGQVCYWDAAVLPKRNIKKRGDISRSS